MYTCIAAIEQIPSKSGIFPSTRSCIFFWSHRDASLAELATCCCSLICPPACPGHRFCTRDWPADQLSLDKSTSNAMSNSMYERFGQPSSATTDATLEPSPRIDDFTKKQYHIPVSSSSEGISSFLAASASSSRSRDELTGRPRAESNGRRRAGPPSLSLETSTPTSPRTSSVRYNNSSADFTSPTTRTTYDQGAIPISPRRNQPGQVFTTPSNPAKPMMSHSISNESGLSYLTDSSSADDLLSPQRAPFDGNATSPVSRSGLIGLGELATPRWTAAGSRWAFSPDTEGRNQVNSIHANLARVADQTLSAASSVQFAYFAIPQAIPKGYCCA